MLIDFKLMTVVSLPDQGKMANAFCDGVGKSGKIWYAQLLLLFSYKRRFGFEVELAFMRWFTPLERPAHARNFRLQPFK